MAWVCVGYSGEELVFVNKPHRRISKNVFHFDAKLPDIDELIKKLASDEFIEKKIKDILGENDVDSGKEK